MGTWGAPGNNREGHVTKKKVGAKVFNEEEFLSSISGKEIGLKASMESRQEQDWCALQNLKLYL